jgi:hypothetical protein
MQPIRTPCQRLAWAIALAAVGFAFPSSAFSLPPPGKRVGFSKHGGDWVQGKCASRNKQSPIDLNEIFKPPSADFHYMYSEVTGEQIEVNNDGRMLSATLVGGGLSRTVASPLTSRVHLHGSILRASTSSRSRSILCVGSIFLLRFSLCINQRTSTLKVQALRL